MPKSWDRQALDSLAAATTEIYERNAAKFVAQRPQVPIEAKWLDHFLALLPATPDILDLGCGAGLPIAAYLTRKGANIVGIDASPTMIDMARKNLPDASLHLADMRTFEIEQMFDGIVGWNSFFHLTKNEQRELLPKLANRLRPNGALLLTVGPVDGEVVGQVGDDAIYHASLSPKEYEERLAACGMSMANFVPEDPDCYQMTILLAQKI